MKIRRIAFAVLAAAMLCGAVSCGRKDAAPEEPKPTIRESQMKEIAELSTLECSFHNVAKYTKENATGMLWWKKDKNFWIEGFPALITAHGKAERGRHNTSPERGAEKYA